MVMERVLHTNRQERFTRPDGTTDLFSRTSVEVIDLVNSAHNHVMHIDSGSGKYVTSTDHERFVKVCTLHGPVRTFWDKRVPLSIKMRG